MEFSSGWGQWWMLLKSSLSNDHSAVANKSKRTLSNYEIFERRSGSADMWCTMNWASLLLHNPKLHPSIELLAFFGFVGGDRFAPTIANAFDAFGRNAFLGHVIFYAGHAVAAQF